MDAERDKPTAETPYEPPAITWEEVFEPYAFKVCGKKPGGGAGCAGAMRFT